MRTLFAVLFLASAVLAQAPETPIKAVPKQGPPPKTLTTRADGHVSANRDAENPEKFEAHVVKQGETLSLISGEVLKNQRLWPQLWEQNEHIVNPHWIYPNDQILIRPVTVLSEAKPPEPEPTPALEPTPDPEPIAEPPRRRVLLPPPTGSASAAAPAMPSAQQQSPAQEVFSLEAQKPVSEIKYDDLYCSGFVRKKKVDSDLKVIAKFDATGAVLASDADYVYLSQGAEDGIAVGSTYQVVRPTKTLTNPTGRSHDERDLGKHYLDVAQLRVVLLQPEFSLARVIHSCADAVDVGDILMPFEQIVLPTPSRPRPLGPMLTTSSGVKGVIVSTKDVMLNFGSSFKATGQIPGIKGGHLGSVERGIASEGAIVYIDIGHNSAAKPGDVFLVYRDTEIDRRLYHFPKEAKKLRTNRTVVGEAVVVKVGERAATALVTYASDALVLGDAVERR